MSILQRFKTLLRDEWYKQGGAVKPFYVGYPARSCLGFTVRGRRVPFNYKPFAWYLWNDFFDVYFPKKRLERIAAWYYRKEMRQPGFLKKLMQRWLAREVAQLHSHIVALERLSFSALDDQKLREAFLSFSLRYDAFWRALAVEVRCKILARQLRRDLTSIRLCTIEELSNMVQQGGHGGPPPKELQERKNGYAYYNKELMTLQQLQKFSMKQGYVFDEEIVQEEKSVVKGTIGSLFCTPFLSHRRRYYR